jgi:hypothetical protein
MLRSGGGGSGESDPATRQGLLRRAAFARGCAAWRVAGTPPLPLPHRLLPPPPVSRRLFPRHCLVDWSGSSPIPCWDWEPRVPNPSEARGNEQAGRLCRASLRPVSSPCARSIATSVHAPPSNPIDSYYSTTSESVGISDPCSFHPSFLWSLSQLRQMPCPMTVPRKPTGMSLSVHFPRNFSFFFVSAKRILLT